MRTQGLNFPKITVITTNLNQDAYLEATILSVINQNYPNLEYIVIDGKSKDRSVEIIKKYQNSLSYWCSEEDDGLYDALNKGFKKSTGAILMWINSDDMLHQGSLHSIAEIFNTFPEVNWITGINISFDEKGRVIGADRAKAFTKYDFYTHNYQWLQQESTVWRRELWEISGGYLSANYKFASDFDLWIRFFRHAKLFPCDILIGGFRMRSENQISLNSFDLYDKEVKQIIAAEKKKLTPKVKRNLFFIKAIKVLRSIMKYSFVLDLKIFTRVLNKLERDLKSSSNHRIHINRLNCKFEMI